MIDKTSWLNVTTDKKRSIISVCTLAMGVFGILFLQSFFSGLIQMHAENSIRSRHGHGQVNIAGYLNHNYEKPWEHWISNADTIQRKIKAIPGVVEVFPRVQFFALLSNGKTSVAGRGQGVIGNK